MMQHPLLQWSIKRVPAIFFSLLGAIVMALSIAGHDINAYVTIIFIVACLPLIFRHRLVHTILGCAFGIISGIYVLLFILVFITGTEDGQDARTWEMFSAGMLAVFSLLCSIAMVHVAQKHPQLSPRL